ncbi:hypothetical protein ES332_A04G066800v1 [Gossypium tomentosum]|uniref:Uncharacterized protein n=1 Tax=Gossypium tomentosum TaxID=34277 RepID=A0A5D2QVM7_GOSTO|nr:hypothetical protein ES332_A04G066700v1 [Gossypium tomentosum]TYI32487.1 hypothetical protein ES332_A04G066800v1 [Gossypium tomentosum]
MEFFVPLSNSITTTEKSLRWRARRDSGVVRGVEGRRYGRWYGTPVSGVVHPEASTWRQRRKACGARV